MTWRKATIEDCRLLGLLNHQLIEDENHRNSMEEPALTERMRGFLSGDYTGIPFEKAGEVVAYALYHPWETDGIYLRQFFVIRERRRRGIGREAVILLFNEIFPPEKRIIVTALSRNRRALAFWAAVGFDEYCVSFERPPRQT